MHYCYSSADVPAKKERWLGMMDDSDSSSDSDDDDDSTYLPSSTNTAAGCSSSSSQVQAIQVVTGNNAHNAIQVLVSDRT